MEIKVIKKLGDDLQITVTAEGSNLTDVLFLVSPIINAPKECGLCHGTDITIETRYVKNGGAKYISYLCNTCKGKLEFHSYLTIKDCYYLQDWKAPYQGGSQQ